MVQVKAGVVGAAPCARGGRGERRHASGVTKPTETEEEGGGECLLADQDEVNFIQVHDIKVRQGRDAFVCRVRSAVQLSRIRAARQHTHTHTDGRPMSTGARAPRPTRSAYHDRAALEAQ